MGGDNEVSNGGELNGRFKTFHHLTFWVSNARQAASYFITRFGFEPLGYKGLETGSRQTAAYAVRNRKIIFVFESQYEPFETDFSKAVVLHGDFVKDIAFEVDEIDNILQYAVKNGAKEERYKWVEKDDDGFVEMATLKTYGDVTHTLLQKGSYKGVFLPGFQPLEQDKIQKFLPDVDIKFIDHVVGNMPDGGMNDAAHWYEKCLRFHKFWSVDEKDVHTEYSALRSIVMANNEETIKIPINEPAPGKKKSQIQEYVEYHGGAGVQHIALNTPDVISAVENLRARGVEFLQIPSKYYDLIRSRLQTSKVQVKESLDKLQELNILIDFDDDGYLLQIFTKNTVDRPTLFIEIIQRNNHNGFGAGNFKTLFESIELEQQKRGNL